MAQCLDIISWRAATPQEVIAFVDRPKSKSKPKRKNTQPSKRAIVVRKYLKPVDVYAYLRARFGHPNGFQNVLRRDDSDNWIHWDFNLKVHDQDVYFSGTARDVHIVISEELSDIEWQELILSIKKDFGRIGHAKSTMTRSFEKYFVFQNKFVALADLCAEMHEAIIDAPPRSAGLLPNSGSSKKETRKFYTAMKAEGTRASGLYSRCLTLRLLTPVMAEAFINMIIITFCKDAIRNDAEQYEQFVRAKIPERLELLSQHCSGFTRDIDKDSDSYKNFMRVMNQRNFAIHGNVG